jgi:hypothetical protein
MLTVLTQGPPFLSGPIAIRRKPGFRIPGDNDEILPFLASLYELGPGHELSFSQRDPH